MKYIDSNKIEELLSVNTVVDDNRVGAILEKAKGLNRLTLQETAALLSVNDAANTEKIFDAAAFVKNAIYGRRVVLFAPLYISNRCINKCQYCSFKADNTSVERRSLGPDEINGQVEWLLNRGHKRILMVTGEATRVNGMSNIDYYLESIKAIYDAQVGPHKIKRVNVNCAPLSVDDFKKLKAAGIGTYQVFQESYHDETYRLMHPEGPKSDPDNPRWLMVDVKYRRKTKRLIGLAEIKQFPDRLEGFALIRRGNRLSIMPVSKEHWDFILSLE